MNPLGEDHLGLPILDEVGEQLHERFRTQEQRRGFLPPITGAWRPRSRILASLTAVLVVGGAATAAVVSSESASPLRALQGGVVCPAGYTFIASARTHLVYPPNYPIYEGSGSLSSKVGGTRCFSSEHAATAAGYKPAAAPAGDIDVDGIYYGQPSSTVLAACRAARRVISAAIFCPTLMPVPWTDPNGYTGTGPDCPTSGCSAPLFSISGAFVGPASYGDGNVAIGDVAIWAMSTTQERQYVGQIGCVSATRIAATTFRGHPADWYDCPDTADSTVSSILEWSIGNENYGISVSGPPAARRQVAQLIATHLNETPAG